MTQCGARFDAKKIHLICTQPDGRAHGTLHSDGTNDWIAGADAVLVDTTVRTDYQMWWEDA